MSFTIKSNVLKSSLDIYLDYVDESGKRNCRKITPGEVELPEGENWRLEICELTDYSLDDLIKNAGTIPNIVLSGAWITEKGKKRLSALSNIRHASFYHNQSADDMEALISWTGLESLHLYPDDNVGFSFLPKYPNLKVLSIRAYGLPCRLLIDDQVMESLANCQKLESLVLPTVGNATPWGISLLRNLKNLQDLSLGADKGLSNECLHDLTHMPNLRKLYVSGAVGLGDCLVTESSDLSALGHTAPMALIRKSGKKKRKAWHVVGKPERIMKINNQFHEFSEQDRKLLGEPEKVYPGAHPVWCGIDRDKDHIAAKLETLDKNSINILVARFNKEITDDVLETISEFKKLQKVDIRGNSSITDAGLMKLGKLEYLNHLVIRGCRNISEEGYKTFQEKFCINRVDWSTSLGVYDNRSCFNYV